MPFKVGKVVHFPAEVCASCPLRERCTTSKTARNLSVHPDEKLLQETGEVYVKLFGKDGVRGGDDMHFLTSRVKGIESIDGGARVILRLPKDKDELKRVEKTGHWYGDVVLAAPAGQGRTLGSRERLDGDKESVQGIWIEYV